MQEKILYAWGASALGECIAPVSNIGLLAFDFGENRTALLNALKTRLHEASAVDDQDGLAGILESLEYIVDQPGQDVAIALDMRGSDYQKRVWIMLRQIQVGETTSYGALAAKLGTRDARDVTEAISSNTIAILVPSHRFIKRKALFRDIVGASGENVS